MPVISTLIGCVDAEQGEKFWETTELQKLDLSFNQIIQLPDQVGRFKSNQINERHGTPFN